MKVYMMVTKDKYSLPLAVVDSIDELVRMTGKTSNCIKSVIAHGKAGRIKKPAFVSVEIKGIERKTAMIKKCEYCGEDFETEDPRRKFCGRSCAMKSRNARRKAQGVPIVRAQAPKSTEPRDGWYRPKFCFKRCIYNPNGGCSYKQDKELLKPIEKWQTCQYFDDGDTFKYERAQSPVHLDTIYGHIAAFKDSHSAVWMY